MMVMLLKQNHLKLISGQTIITLLVAGKLAIKQTLDNRLHFYKFMFIQTNTWDVSTLIWKHKNKYNAYVTKTLECF